jgi:ribosome-associated translation inhibitor RaiA
MQKEPRIAFQNMDASPALESDIRERIARLEEFHARLIGCSVVVQAPHRHSRKGRIYEIRIDLSLPGEDIAVTRESGLDHAHEDVHVALRDAFDAARRLLEDRQRREAPHRSKKHPDVGHGLVVRLFAEDGYGFLETADVREVYFQRNGLTGQTWDRIAVGSKLRFKELDGDKGPFATQVTLMD